MAGAWYKVEKSNTHPESWGGKPHFRVVVYDRHGQHAGESHHSTESEAHAVGKSVMSYEKSRQSTPEAKREDSFFRKSGGKSPWQVKPEDVKDRYHPSKTKPVAPSKHGVTVEHREGEYETYGDHESAVSAARTSYLQTGRHPKTIRPAKRRDIDDMV